MPDSTHTLLTIITESALENSLKRVLEANGAPGYTIVDARGKGHRGARDGSWSEASTNILIEVVCDHDVAQRIAADMRARYFDDYGMTIYLRRVEVLRPEKF